MNYSQELEALYRKALELKSQNRPAESEALEVQAAEILEKIQQQVAQAPEDPETATLLLFLAEREWPLLGDHEDVQTKIKRALELREKRFGTQHALTAEALAKLAEFHFLAGRFGEAEPLFRRSVPGYPRALGGLAQTLAALGRTEEADPYFVQAIEQSPNDEPGKRSLYFLLIYRAEGLEKMGRQPEAQALRQKAAGLLHQSNPGEFGYRV